MADTSFFLARINAQIERDRARHAEHGWAQTKRSDGGHTIGDLSTTSPPARRFRLSRAALIERGG